MHVLIIGYGKIGQIKARLWKSLDATVYIYDSKASAIKKALGIGYQPYNNCLTVDELIIDISSPSEQHYKSLVWAINKFQKSIKLILIEKPLTSSKNELEYFLSLDESIKSKIVLNESYFSSTGLLKLIKTISGAPAYVEIELSKNRLFDIAQGRFFDKNLGSIGIETPHMLAILQMLGIQVNNIEITYANLYIKLGQIENQGFEIHFSSNGTAIVLKSFLGDFTCSESKLMYSNSTVRRVKVRTKTQECILEFDPATMLPRYHSRLTSRRFSQQNKRVREFADDHLKQHMLQLTNGCPVNHLLRFDNAIHLSSILIQLRDNVKVIHLTNDNGGTPQEILTKKGLIKCQSN